MAPQAEIRPARFGEEGAVLAMYEWLFAPPGSRPPGFDPSHAAAAIAEAIAGRESEIIVAEEAGPLVGFLSVYLDLNSVRFGRRAWVEDFAVDPGRRSAGVGHSLLDAARRWGREHRASHLELDSGSARTDAHRFYDREQPDWSGNQYSWLLGE